MSSNIINLYATGTGGAEAMGMGASGTIIWLVIMIALFYFMLIRPQKKKDKKVKEMLDALKHGDRVTTIGGIYGTIVGIKDDEVTFETGAAKTRLTIKKWAIQTREGPEVEAPVEAEAEEESK